jgi:hypothetical protein
MGIGIRHSEVRKCNLQPTGLAQNYQEKLPRTKCVPPNSHHLIQPLIQEALAVGRAAKTRDSIRRADFALELVVVREFVICQSVSFG